MSMAIAVRRQHVTATAPLINRTVSISYWVKGHSENEIVSIIGAVLALG